MKTFYIFLSLVILLLLPFSNIGQVLRVYDQTTLVPVENVDIFNESRIKSLNTDNEGKADFGIFASNDVITFEHPSYQTLKLTYTEVEQKAWKVYLNETSVNFNAVVSTFSKWEESSNEIPAKIEVISSKEIAFMNPQNGAEIPGIGGLVFNRTGAPGCGTPMLRGFRDDAVLMILDGVRINNPVYRGSSEIYTQLVDPFSLDKVTILFGPASGMYGSDAIGGVIDYQAKKVKFSEKSKMVFDGNVVTRYSSANAEKAGHVDFNLAGKKFGMLTSFTYQETDDIEMGSKDNESFRRPEFVETIDNNDVIKTNDDPDIQKYTGYDHYKFMQKFSLMAGENTRLDYAFHYHSSSDIPFYEGLLKYTNDSLLQYAQAYYGSNEWMMNSLSLVFEGSYSLCDEGRITISQQKAEQGKYFRTLFNPNIRWQEQTIDIYSLNVDMNKSLDEKNKMEYGLEAIYNSISSEGLSRNIFNDSIVPSITVYPDDGSTYMSFAGYFGFKSNFDKKATFQASTRYTHVFLNSAFKDTIFFNFPFKKIEINTGSFSGNMGIVYHPDPKWQFRANASTGFRAPNLDDFAGIYSSVPGTVILPNKNLKPEGVFNFELGIIKQVKNSVKFDISGFYTYLVNYMTLQDIRYEGQDSIWFNGVHSDIEGLVNNGGGWLYGLNGSVDAEFLDHFSFFSDISMMKGEDRDEKPLQGISPMFASAGLAYKAKQLKLQLYMNYNSEFSYDNFPVSEINRPHIYALNEDGKPYSPEWMTLNFKAAFQLHKMVQLNAGIENITDARYRPYASAITSAGRNIVAAIRFSF